MEDVTIADLTETLGCVTVLGPAAAACAEACTGVSIEALNALPEHGHLPLEVRGAFVGASREFGVPAFDLFAPKANLETWRPQLQARIPSPASGYWKSHASRLDGHASASTCTRTPSPSKPASSRGPSASTRAATWARRW